MFVHIHTDEIDIPITVPLLIARKKNDISIWFNKIESDTYIYHVVFFIYLVYGGKLAIKKDKRQMQIIYSLQSNGPIHLYYRNWYNRLQIA